MGNYAAILILAVIVEGTVNILKSLYTDGKLNKTVLLSLVVGIVLAFTTGLDLLAVAGVEALVPHVGVALTGIFVSRGSNYLHDLIEKLTDIL